MSISRGGHSVGRTPGRVHQLIPILIPTGVFYCVFEGEKPLYLLLMTDQKTPMHTAS